MSLTPLLRRAGRLARPSGVVLISSCAARCGFIRHRTDPHKAPRVEIEYPSKPPKQKDQPVKSHVPYYGIKPGATTAFIALGSNIGNRVGWIEEALKLLDSEAQVQVLQTSSLWETKAMYVCDQPPFLNGACEILTTLDPDPLMATLKRIESKLCREKTMENGPRNIDLDLLLYGEEFIYRDREEVLQTMDRLAHKDELFVPHLRMLEREFVLRPMCQLSPKAPISTTKYNRNEREPGNDAWRWHYKGLLRRVVNAPGSPGILRRMIRTTSPLRPIQCLQDLQSAGHLGGTKDQMSAYTPLTRDGRPLSAQSRTHIMAILNLTPDSFSDGGQNLHSDPSSPEYLSSLKSTVLSHISSGATIIDIGGQSTRPRAPMVSADVELSRILPAISLIKSLPEAANVVISIDTFRASVARAAITAGADMINDVSAGALDPDMLPTVADLNCTICLMHMRGTPETMTGLTSYNPDLIKGVSTELLYRIRVAEEAGIRRWRIILDPGIGFAKNREQNIQLLRDLGSLTTLPALAAFPWLVGPSRKGFIGDITATRAPKDRLMGTAVSVVHALQAYANIVRVHDVKPIKETIDMAEALRAPKPPAPFPWTVPPLRFSHIRRFKPSVLGPQPRKAFLGERQPDPTSVTLDYGEEATKESEAASEEQVPEQTTEPSERPLSMGSRTPTKTLGTDEGAEEGGAASEAQVPKETANPSNSESSPKPTLMSKVDIKKHRRLLTRDRVRERGEELDLHIQQEEILRKHQMMVEKKKAGLEPQLSFAQLMKIKQAETNAQGTGEKARWVEKMMRKRNKKQILEARKKKTEEYVARQMESPQSDGAETRAARREEREEKREAKKRGGKQGEKAEVGVDGKAKGGQASPSDVFGSLPFDA